MDSRRGAYGRSYARGLASSMNHGSEQIEMENVMHEPWDEADSDYER